MKLTADNFPLSCSLQSLVQDVYGGSAKKDDAHVMPLDELIGYLRTPSDIDLAPYADLLSQTEKMGDPALPSREHTAILRWVGEAMHHFEQRFPLEEPLASQVRRLKPLAATLALVDPQFMQPDAHPLQQLLDAIHERAVGWQANLGRTGSLLEQQVATAVEGALAWLDDNSVDLAAVCANYLAAAERDQSRAERMSRRVVETELGRLKTAEAKREAARMINALLDKYPAPAEIGTFLKGHWYSSAQLLLLKFGADSEQWARMSETTESLLDSVQSLEDVSEERRQHIFAVVTQLPKDMRRWLLSLHHDTEAVNDAMATIESAHLRILRRQPVELQKLGAIDVAGAQLPATKPQLVKALRPIQQGQWFAIDSRKQGAVRAQLALKDESAQRLLFTNLAGMKVLDFNFAEFDQVLEKECVTALPTGRGFSLCLAIAAGVDTTEKLDALYRSLSLDVPEVEAEDTDPPGAAQTQEEDLAQPPADLPAGATEDADNELLDKDELAELEALIGEAYAAPAEFDNETEGNEPQEAPAPPTAPEAGARTETQEQAEEPGPETAAPAQDESAAQTPQDPGEPDADPEESVDEAPADGIAGYEVRFEEMDEDEDLLHSLDDELETEPDETLPPADGDADPAQEPEPTAEAAEEPQDTAPDTALPAGQDTSQQALQPAPEQAADTPEMPPSRPAAPYLSDPKESWEGWLQPPENKPAQPDPVSPDSLDLTMGAWLGFHDGETPLMAKLAVHDPGSDTYIFVNRQGIKMREIGGEELADLVSRGLVDILQPHSSFRRDVDVARRELDD